LDGFCAAEQSDFLGPRRDAEGSLDVGLASRKTASPDQQETHNDCVVYWTSCTIQAGWVACGQSNVGIALDDEKSPTRDAAWAGRRPKRGAVQAASVIQGSCDPGWSIRTKQLDAFASFDMSIRGLQAATFIRVLLRCMRPATLGAGPIHLL
jgi:hypothetical protein